MLMTYVYFPLKYSFFLDGKMFGLCMRSLIFQTDKIFFNVGNQFLYEKYQHCHVINDYKNFETT